ncbi:hypothetical protein HDE_12400 [Halotydeus destructor]|nr:hypothetical protein HDE_12400 [Halotydeus destructor]
MLDLSSFPCLASSEIVKDVISDMVNMTISTIETVGISKVDGKLLCSEENGAAISRSSATDFGAEGDIEIQQEIQMKKPQDRKRKYAYTTRARGDEPERKQSILGYGIEPLYPLPASLQRHVRAGLSKSKIRKSKSLHPNAKAMPWQKPQRVIRRQVAFSEYDEDNDMSSCESCDE